MASLVSVIIPVSEYHRESVRDAIESLEAQTIKDFEPIIVSDRGAGAARNQGLRDSKSPLVFFLDADDMLEPTALEKMLNYYASRDAGYIYSDAKVLDKPKQSRILPSEDYDRTVWHHRAQHTVSILIATADARSIWFDESLELWEDWDFLARCAVQGICGARIAEPLLIYRQYLGQRSQATTYEAAEIIRQRYQLDLMNNLVPCRGANADAVKAIKRMKDFELIESEPMVRLRYYGAYKHAVGYYANGNAYTVANTPEQRDIFVRQSDVDALLQTKLFKIYTPKPEPVAVVAPRVPPTLPARPQAQTPEVKKRKR